MVVTKDNQPVEFATEGVRALFAYLLAHPDKPFTRVQLATLLWPEHPQEKALRNLRMTLTRLRQAIGNERISEESSARAIIIANRVHIKSVTTNHVTLDTTEVSRWQQQLETHSNKKNQRRIIRLWEKILANHRGKFLADLRWSSPIFEEWRSQQERHWHFWALMGWDLLTAHYSSISQTEKVIFAAQKLLTLEPWHEKAHSYLIQAWLSRGNRINAINQYEQYKTILHEEFQLQPSERFRTLWEQAQQQPNHQITTKPLNAVRSQLPAVTTRFFGRKKLLQQIETLILEQEERFISLVGAGGVGKSRLAIACGEKLSDYFSDGTFFIPLVGISGDTVNLMEEIAATITAKMNIAVNGRDTIVEQLCKAIKDKECLLILDNFEHLVDAAEIVSIIVQSVPRSAVLATSREPLNFQAEYILRLKGLQFPESLKESGTTSAWLLFTDRLAKHGHVITESEHSDVVDICRFVEGHPLALELIAAMFNRYSMDQIQHILKEEAEKIETTYRDVPARHKTMWAVFEASWQTLTQTQQTILASLSIFRGKFSSQATQQISSILPNQLHALCQKSLIQSLPNNYFILHEIIRQFAEEKAKQKELTHHLVSSHTHYYLSVCLANQEHKLFSTAALTVMRSIQEEEANLRQAWHWAVAAQEWELIALAFPALNRLHVIRGLLHPILSLIEIALSRLSPDIHPTLFYKLRMESAHIRQQLGQFDLAQQLAKDVIANSEIHRDRGLLALSHRTLGNVLEYQGEVKACRKQYQTALGHAEAQDNEQILAVCLNALSYFISGTTEHQEEAQQIAKNLGDSWLEARILNGLAISAANGGDYEKAYHFFHGLSELPIWPEEFHFMQGRIFGNLANVCRLLGQYDLAQTYYAKSWEIAERTYDHRIKGAIHLGKAQVLYTKEMWESAENHLQQARDWQQQHGGTADLLFINSWQGLVSSKKGDYKAAIRAFEESITLANETDLHEFGLISQAGYAYLVWEQGQSEYATNLIEDVIAFLAKQEPNPTIWPTYIYAQTTQVLYKMQDERLPSFINQARNYIGERTAQIKTTHWQRIYRTEEYANHLFGEIETKITQFKKKNDPT